MSFHSYTAGKKIFDNDTKPPLYLYIPWLVNLSENTLSHSCRSHSWDSFHKNWCKTGTDLFEELVLLLEVVHKEKVPHIST